VNRWQRYWFAEGGRTSAAVLRVAIALAVLLALRHLASLSTVRIPGPASLYRPVGIWMLFGHLRPPPFVVTGLWVIAWAASGTMLLGLFSRASTAVSFAASLALISGSFSSSATWSHQYNVVCLAQLAFLGARGGDVLSLDAAIRRWRGLPEINIPRGYQWSVRLVQLAVAFMFAGAAFHKILHAKFTLNWALSDNLRHQLLVHYDLANMKRTAVASWIIDDVWRYRVAAVMNLISQASPILACIFVRRPLVRMLAGAFFVTEVIALALVVNLWNPHWLPLVAVFIDWEWLTRRARPPAAASDWRPPRGQARFVIAFVAYDAFTALIPRVDQWLNTYPFSAFPMFASVRAREPYDEHLPYQVPGDHFVAISDKPIDARAQSWIDHLNRRLYLVTDPKVFKNRLAAILSDAQTRFPEFGIHGMQHFLTIFEAPAYPAPAHFEPHPIAEMAEIDSQGTFKTALGSVDDDGVTLKPQNLDTANARLVIFIEDQPIAHEQPVSARQGDRFVTGKIEGDPLYVAAMIDGQAWLVATRRAWKWE
jgi:hypothetical protein